MTTAQLPHNRGRDRGEGKKETVRKQHMRTHLKIYLHTTSQHLMSLSYLCLWGLCWFLLRSSETPRANSKGSEVSALLTCQRYELYSEWLTHCSAPHPVAALPHYPLKLIRTGKSSKGWCKPQFIPLFFRQKRLCFSSVRTTNWSLFCKKALCQESLPMEGRFGLAVEISALFKKLKQ